MVIVDAEAFDPGAMLARLCAGDPDGDGDSGGVVSFVGLCRGGSGVGSVTALILDAHPTYTTKAIAGMEDEARRRWPVHDVVIRHRHGRVAPGEAIVFVGVAARHRRAAFEAADYLMDQLKTRAPLWKKEEGEAGTVWLDPKPEEMERAARWNGMTGTHA